MIDNPFAWIGRVDCRPCKDRRFRYGTTPKVACRACRGLTYILICLLCENPYPQECHCYEWMYEKDWFWKAVKRTKKMSA